MDIFNDFEDILLNEEVDIIDRINPERRMYNTRNRFRHVHNFNLFDDIDFHRRFRLSKDTVLHILGEVQEHLTPLSGRNNPISPLEQLLIGLRFLATDSFYVTLGDFGGIHKSTAGKIISKVMSVIAGLRQRYINMPSTQEQQNETMKKFYNLARFPRVLGAIDCTHIRIQSVGGPNAEVFRNRKGYFSLNVQVVVDSENFIKDIVVRWPGSAHDTNIFENSFLRMRFENGDFGNGLLLGDSGYPLRNYLVTPLNNPTTEAENLFNEAQIRTRNVVERTFGIWKRRFPVLSYGLRCHLPLAQNTIIAAAVIHNIATIRNDMLPDNGDMDIDIDNWQIDVQPIRQDENDRIRRLLIEYFAGLNNL